MFRKKYYLYIMGLISSIFLGSLIFIMPSNKELWIFLQIVSLPAIYFIGYEILMNDLEKRLRAKSRKTELLINKIYNSALKIELENKELKNRFKRLKKKD